MIAAVYGLLNNGIYRNLMPAGFVAAQYSQDILTIIVCALLLFLIQCTTEKSFKEPIIIIGILGSLAYLYGIFSIERVYNILYLVYLAILSVTFYTGIYSISSFRTEIVAQINVPKLVRNTTAAFSVLVGGLFTVLWINALLPLMATGNQIDNLYSIYILDLVFIMPAFFITAIMTFRRQPLGYVLTPALYILGIFVIFPLGLGELAKMLPQFGMTPDFKSMTMSFVLAGLFLLGSTVQIRTMEIGDRRQI
ncbi:MAG: hypothetical protein NTV45_06610 [Firmicutes bacterium]|nr:hypothetical protein [Bacillota bacterium]